MIRRTFALILVLALGTTGCATGDNQASPPPPPPPQSHSTALSKPAAPTPTPTRTPTTNGSTEPSSETRTLKSACDFLDQAVRNHRVGQALALTDPDQKNAQMRAAVAETYDTFSEYLIVIGISEAPANSGLGLVLTRWADASRQVANYVRTTKPRKGDALDVGPSYGKWQTARKSAEKICGHSLPKDK